jgi:hypothetical protein
VHVDLALTAELNGKHGYGRGVCPIKRGESTTRLALLDLDSHKGESTWDEMADAAALICAELERRGLRPIPFRSSGGNGIHLYMLWREAQDAYSVRKLLADALAATGFKSGTGGVAAREIEVFPKQDSVRPDGCGSMFVLPGFKQSCPLDLLAFDSADSVTWRISADVPVVARPERLAPVSTAPREADAETLRRELFKHDAGAPHDEWLHNFQAAHWQSQGADWGFEIVDEWGRGARGYKGREELRARWDSLHADHPNAVTSFRRIEKPASADDFEVVRPSTLAVKVAPPTGLRLRRQKDGRALAEIANVLAVLRSDACSVEVRHDQFRDELMLAPRGTDEWRACRDTDVTAIQEAFERAEFKPISREIMRNALHKIGDEQSFDSATHWLDSLRWDGERRVGGFLHEYFRAEGSEYTRAVSSYLWTALAGRVLEPGCQADMVPVLVGDQGQRKSSALAAMVPAPEHFTGFGFEKIGHPDTSRRMRGVLLGEIAELKGINSRDIESIKDWITRRYERWTPKYQEFDATFPRRLVFVGTTNNVEFLADKTGNRRWLPVTVGQADRDAIDRDRNQLWAEARELFRASGIAWQEAERLAPTVHDEYAISDSWEDAISEWLSQPADFDDLTRDVETPLRGDRPFTVGEVLRGALGFQASAISKAPEMRAAEILRDMGFRRERLQVNGVRKWAWTR